MLPDLHVDVLLLMTAAAVASCYGAAELLWRYNVEGRCVRACARGFLLSRSRLLC